MVNKLISELGAEKGIQRLAAKISFRMKQPRYEKNEASGNGGEKPFSHVTYCVATNAGDTVLSQCVRRTIESQFKTSGWNLINVTREVNSDTIRAINDCGMLVIGGGGLFLPDTNKNTISGWQWAIPEELLDKIEVPICIYSVGYNYFHGQETNELFKEALTKLAEKSSFFGLRNMGSVNAIKGMLPNELSSKVTFQPCTTTLIRKLYNDSIPQKSETSNIAVNMAFDRASLRFGYKKDDILQQVADAVKQIQLRGYKIFYVCHCWDDDLFLPYLKESSVDYTLVDLSRKYPADVIKFYNNMDLVLGMRGHAQMIPFGLNCEIISLGTHDKMKWFLDDIHAEDWYIDLTKEIDQISEKVQDVFENIHERNKSITKERLLEAQNMLWNITEENLKVIRGGVLEIV